MLCFEVTVNGKLACVAGVGDVGALNIDMTWATLLNEKSNAVSSETELKVTGYDFTHHISWIGPGHTKQVLLKPGDEVKVLIVEREAADEPVILAKSMAYRQSIWSRLMERLRR